MHISLEGMGFNKHSEIAAAIGGKKVICFVRHYNIDFQGGSSRESSGSGQLSRYTIIKLYTEEEIQSSTSLPNPIDEENCIAFIKTTSNTESGSSSSAQAVHTYSFADISMPEKQFFSPNTSMVLESIAHKVDDVATSGNIKQATKRALTFTDNEMETDLRAGIFTPQKPKIKRCPVAPDKRETSAAHKKPREKIE
ncbi:NAC-like [Striga asiatica]|uniref:NAC-like n=1 Tax=Striga asiatica TaxID=4170 RepID=A0A5A7RIM9_STRAF|nr:NAC-like [Striga asiatica]